MKMTQLLEDKLAMEFTDKIADQVVKIVKPLNDRIAALEDVVRELVKHGDDVSSIFGKSRFQAQSDIDAWRSSVRKALELLNQNGGK